MCWAWSCIKYKLETILPWGLAVRSINLGVKAVSNYLGELNFGLILFLMKSWVNKNIFGLLFSLYFTLVWGTCRHRSSPCPGLALCTWLGKLDCLFVKTETWESSFSYYQWKSATFYILQDALAELHVCRISCFHTKQNTPWETQIPVFYYVNFKVWNNPWSQSWQSFSSGYLKVNWRTNAKEKAS